MDSHFQIVKRDGKLGVAQLSRVVTLRRIEGITTKPDATEETLEKAKCLTIKGSENMESELEKKTEEASLRIKVIKNYSRCRIDRAPTQKVKAENVKEENGMKETLDSIKVEPEIVTADEVHDKEQTQKLPGVKCFASTTTHSRRIDFKAPIIRKSKHPILKLPAKNLKCNFCGMIFNYVGQFIHLRAHFLSHKRSLIHGPSSTTDVDCESEKTEEKTELPRSALEKQTTKPIILNDKLRYTSTQNRISSGKSNGSEDTRRTVVNIKLVPRFIAKQLRKSNPMAFKQQIGNSEFFVGSTLVKPVKPVARVRVPPVPNREVCGGNVTDEDDDVEIIEVNQDVIVIDDEDDKRTKCP